MKNKNINNNSSLKLLKLGVAVCYLFCFYVVQAQDAVTQYADSLLNNARTAPTKELKIEALLKVSYFWSDRDTTKAYKYLAEARQQMGKSPTDFQLGVYHFYRAGILMEYAGEEAKSEYLKADTLLATDTSPKSYLYRSKLWNNYGIIILHMENKEEEVMQLIVNKTIPYARLSGDSTQVAYQLHNMAMQLVNINDYDAGATYYQAALHTLENSSGADDTKFEMFGNAARNEIFRRDFKQAKLYLDSARSILPRVQYSTYLPKFYEIELSYFRHTKNIPAAKKSYEKGIVAAEKLNDSYMLYGLNYEFHLLYKDIGQYETAKKYLIRTQEIGRFDMGTNVGMYYRDRADIEFKLKNYKTAYIYKDSLYQEQENLYMKDLYGKILILEKQYKTAEKENQILRLEAQNRQQELKLAHSRWWELVLGGGLVFALCIAYFSWKIGKKNKKLLTQKDLLHKKELRSMRQQERLNQYEAMLQGQESERSRMAKDLHDGLGGLLAGVKLKLSSIVTKTGAGNPDKKSAINDVIHQLDYSVDELRRISHNMMPESLRYGGLAPALSDLCRYMNTPSVQVVFQDLGINDNYSDQLRVTVYRVVQELLANAVKHANATKIILQCSKLDSWLFVTVEDNGKGMEQNGEYQEKGLGLANIRNRISLLNGDIEIISGSDSGTTINIQIPL